MKADFKSDVFEAIHHVVKGMANAGTVSESAMREFDALCLHGKNAATPAKDRRRKQPHQIK